MVIALATACLAVDEESRTVRLAIGSVAPTIVRCRDAEALAGLGVEFERHLATAGLVEQFGEMAAAASRPIDDHRASAAYRRQAIKVLSSRLLRRAFPND